MTITEGKAILNVHNEKIVSKRLEVFYNPKMKLNRDLCITILKASKKTDMKIALPLAGSGVRAIRLLKELSNEAIKEIHINDISSEAINSIYSHLKLNNLDNDKRITVTQKDANLALMEQDGFDYIDLDPFGSPNQFLDATLRKLSRNALVAITATDTASLAGRYREVCERKYWARSLKGFLQHELGLRILIRRIQLIAMEQERALEPIFTYHDEHYYRIYCRVHRSRTQAQQLFSNLNWYVYVDNTSGSYEVTKEYKEETASIKRAGPMYGGKLHNNDFLEHMKSVDEKHSVWFTRLQEDNAIEQVGFFDTHTICQLEKVSIQSIGYILETLRRQGYQAVQSTIEKTGIKTNAPFSVVKEACTKKGLINV